MIQKTESPVVRPVTEDGLVGYDRFGQFIAVERISDNELRVSHIDDVRDKVCRICNQPWKASAKDLLDQREWSLIGAPVHQTCFTRWLGLVERRDFAGMLTDAGISHHGVKEQPNKYWGSEHFLGGPTRPWYYVELRNHPIRIDIGWRKRVIHIELTAQGKTSLDFHVKAAKAFSTEDVSKSFHSDHLWIHAWDKDKAKSYLTTLNKLVMKTW